MQRQWTFYDESVSVRNPSESSSPSLRRIGRGLSPGRLIPYVIMVWYIPFHSIAWLGCRQITRISQIGNGGKANGLCEVDLDLETEFSHCSARVWNVNGRRCAGRRTEDLDVVCCAEGRTDRFGEFANREPVWRTDVVWPSRFASVEDGEEPFDEIVGVKITAQRRPVALDDDRHVVQAVLDEVADGEMDVAVEIRAGEGEAAGDKRRNVGFDAHALCGEFAASVCCCRHGRRIFGDCGSLWPVHRTGGREKETFCATGLGEIEDMSRSVKDGGGHFVVGKGRYCRSGGVDDGVEIEPRISRITRIGRRRRGGKIREISEIRG